MGVFFCFFFKRLCVCIKSYVSERTEYCLRNAVDISVLSRRTDIVLDHFFPFVLTTGICYLFFLSVSDSLSTFKQLLKRSMFRSLEVPSHFVSGPRMISVYHCILRNNCSNINKNLFNNHPRPTACECGFESWDAEHCFFLL